MGLLSNRAYLVRPNNVLTEGKLDNQKESGDSEEKSANSEAMLLATSVRIWE